jgi:hypothetical protein
MISGEKNSKKFSFFKIPLAESFYSLGEKKNVATNLKCESGHVIFFCINTRKRFFFSSGLFESASVLGAIQKS